MTEKFEIPATFLQKASGVLNTLSGSKIIDAFLEYGERWNVSLPYFEYPLRGLTSKRQIIYENLKAFSPSQQFLIIEELCEHPSFSPSAPSKNTRVTLKQELYSKYKKFHSVVRAKASNSPAMRVTYNDHIHSDFGGGTLSGTAIVLWLLSRPVMWSYHTLLWFGLSIVKETSNRIVQIIGGVIALALIGYFANLITHLHQ